jgi:MtN3 and saliva related transmembrane protein
MSAAGILGPIATALSVGFVWPQVARVYRQRTVEGLSPKGTLHGVAATASWALYGIVTGVVPLIVSNLTVCLAMVLIGLAQAREGVLPARLIGVTAAVTVGVGLLASLVSPALAGWIAIVVGATSILPQTFHVLRSPDLSGVSVAMYALLIVTALAWSSYGFLIGDPLLAGPNVIVLPCSVLVLVKALRFQSEEPEAVPALAPC